MQKNKAVGIILLLPGWKNLNIAILRFTVVSASFLHTFKDYAESDTRTGEVDYEYTQLEIAYEDDEGSGKIQYAFHRYEDYAAWITFIKKAQLRYDFDDNHALQGGITRVPFGITPFAILSWFAFGYFDTFPL